MSGEPRAAGGDRRLLWGDIHNHNAVGYAKGSLERSIEIAREHLDFFAFTGHASWHDIPVMPEGRHRKWLDGFEVHRAHWPKTRSLIEEANDGEFVAYLGYEWHSSAFGDFCLIFPRDESELYLPDNPTDLFSFAYSRGALAIPHHVAYAQGRRGANWSVFDPKVTPVVEIFSEHGCTESDRAPYPMILHSTGGRSYRNSVERRLRAGLRFGFVASSDDHLGYPGAYGEGVLGVWADDLSREAILEAIRSRRTYAVTGDRIELDVAVNGAPMGSELAHRPDRRISVSVTAQDSIAMIELVKNGRVIRRHFPQDGVDARRYAGGRAKCRVQYGWGPWADLDLARVCPWELTVSIERGRILEAVPCFQSGPFNESRRDRIRRISESAVAVSSFTSRREAFLSDPTKSVVLALEGSADAKLRVSVADPAPVVRETALAELVDDNIVAFTGEFPAESFMVHRLLLPEEAEATAEWEDVDESDASSWYYVRVRCDNGQMAWSSPIWVNGPRR